MLTEAEVRVLKTFQQFHMSPHQMLCFNGPQLQNNGSALESLIDKDLLIREKFKGGFSLTRAGYAAMHQCG